MTLKKETGHIEDGLIPGHMDRRGNDRDVEDLSHFCVGRLLPT